MTDDQNFEKEINQIRQDFEDWFSSRDPDCPSIERTEYGYKLAQTQAAWPVWQAAQSRYDNTRRCDELINALDGLLKLHQQNSRETTAEEVAAEYALAKWRGAK